jgi:hypothetical protein
MSGAILAATDETDAGAHEALHGMPVEVDSESAEPAQVTHALRGQSMDTGRGVPRRRLASLFGVSAVLGAVVAVVALGATRRHAPAPAASVSAPAPEPTPEPAQVESAAPATAPAASRPPARVHLARPRAKPIAATPGF